MEKESYKYHLKLITTYCTKCKNLNSGKDGPCPRCIFKSKRIAPLPPISFEEKKDGTSS